MTDPSRPGEAHVRRRYDRPRQVILAEGEFSGLFASWRAHAQRWELPVDPLGDLMMRQGLAAVTLHLSGRAADESVAFTLNFRQPPTNIFLAGDGERSTVAGRLFAEGVRTAETSRLFVQSQRPRSEPIQSMIPFDGLDLLVAFEEYYSRSEQSPARFFELGADRFLMVHGLPDSDWTWIRMLTPADALELDLEEHPVLVDRHFRFQCGCNPGKMQRALHAIFGNRPGELFQGESGVETFCPRCGARWWIERQDFEAWTDDQG